MRKISEMKQTDDRIKTVKDKQRKMEQSSAVRLLLFLPFLLLASLYLFLKIGFYFHRFFKIAAVT